MSGHEHAETTTRPACCCVCSRRETGMTGKQNCAADAHYRSLDEIYCAPDESDWENRYCIEDMSRCPLPIPAPRPLDFVTCDQCRYQKCDDSCNPEGDPPYSASCPHAYWDEEFGTWREAYDMAPTCHLGLPKITPRPDGCPWDGERDCHHKNPDGWCHLLDRDCSLSCGYGEQHMEGRYDSEELTPRPDGCPDAQSPADADAPAIKEQ